MPPPVASKYSAGAASGGRARTDHVVDQHRAAVTNERASTTSVGRDRGGVHSGRPDRPERPPSISTRPGPPTLTASTNTSSSNASTSSVSHRAPPSVAEKPRTAD